MIEQSAAFIPAATRLGLADRLGHLRMRVGLGRGSYRVAPGLYGAGAPGPDSPVFVTANYKYSFDHLRSALDGLDAWLLVLDTKGINVWCAAGKGTFGTFELCRRVEETGLAGLVKHRSLILPQLGAVGVSAHETAKISGFKVQYGPVRAADIPAWLAAGRKKDESMRLVSFNLLDRFLLAPVELSGTLPAAAGLAVPALGLALLRGRGFSAGFASDMLGYYLFYIAALAAGAFIFPLLLPWLPGRAFSAKGGFLGAAAALGIILAGGASAVSRDPLTAAGALLVSTAIAAFCALNFTGASVFTSQSGTQLEMKYALPAVIGAAGLGLALQAAGAILGGML